jgi:hypothetical protein
MARSLGIMERKGKKKENTNPMDTSVSSKNNLWLR